MKKSKYEVITNNFNRLIEVINQIHTVTDGLVDKYLGLMPELKKLDARVVHIEETLNINDEIDTVD